MATSYTTYLKLKLLDTMTADTIYNLQRIDQLGSVTNISDNGVTTYNSQEDIVFQPNSQTSGGSGLGGEISFSTASQILDQVSIYSAIFTLEGTLEIKDAAVGGTKYLSLRYKSDLNGSVDTTADRQLSLDLDGADRNLVIATDLSVNGPGTLSLTAPVNTILILPATAGTTGQVLSTDGSGTTSWITASGGGGGGSVASFVGTWALADGTSKSITHNLNTQDVAVFIREVSSNEYISIDTISPATVNSVQLTASEAPDVSGWRVYIIGN